MYLFQKTLLGVAFSFYLASCGNRPTRQPQPLPEVQEVAPFNKEGELYFISKASGDTIQRIDIELARTDEERATGLMYRKSMLETQGMLFIFSEQAQQSFYMKNTYISLDIVYVDQHKEIVSIKKYATPLSKESLPSYKEAMYVVEVNSGFIDRHKIQYGDKIAFTTLK